MEKIVVVTNKTGNDKALIELLNALFPECEIYTFSGYRDGLETQSNDSSQGNPRRMQKEIVMASILIVDDQASL